MLRSESGGERGLFSRDLRVSNLIQRDSKSFFWCLRCVRKLSEIFEILIHFFAPQKCGVEGAMILPFSILITRLRRTSICSCCCQRIFSFPFSSSFVSQIWKIFLIKIFFYTLDPINFPSSTNNLLFSHFHKALRDNLINLPC
jgi:hypothetical protein